MFGEDSRIFWRSLAIIAHPANYAEFNIIGALGKNSHLPTVFESRLSSSKAGLSLRTVFLTANSTVIRPLIP